jgi:mRNA-degrading endonuclease RelE of RelBE toxin-antitoxin system
MKVKLSLKAAKQLAKLHEPLKSRLIAALDKLEEEPPQGDIKHLMGSDASRLRVGAYRVLFGYRHGNIIVTDIGSRGQIYKKGGKK